MVYHYKFYQYGLCYDVCLFLVIAVALSPLVLRSVLMKGQGGGEGRVEVWKVPSPLQLSPASEVHLTPL